MEPGRSSGRALRDTRLPSCLIRRLKGTRKTRQVRIAHLTPDHIPPIAARKTWKTPAATGWKSHQQQRYCQGVLILLPPSEGKTAPLRGAAVNLEAMSHPGLNTTRERVLDELALVSKQPDALEQLGVGASLAAEVERNVGLRGEPAAPARTVYSGVLYDALGLAAMTPTQRAKADAHVRIVSALWGVLSPADLIPAYRLSMGVSLGMLGPLAALWREVLDAELAPLAHETVVVDCRSSTYVNAWKPAPGSCEWVSVKVLRELNGKRSVVSHNAKHTRGLLARHLLTRRGNTPTSAAELLRAARGSAAFDEVSLLEGKQGAFTLEIVVKE